MYESFLNSYAQANENKSCMGVDESGEARVCMRVFSTLVPRPTRTKVAWSKFDGQNASELELQPLINSHSRLTEALTTHPQHFAVIEIM